MDLIVSGGGGATSYTIRANPKMEGKYLKANEKSKVNCSIWSSRVSMLV